MTKVVLSSFLSCKESKLCALFPDDKYAPFFTDVYCLFVVFLHTKQELFPFRTHDIFFYLFYFYTIFGLATEFAYVNSTRWLKQVDGFLSCFTSQRAVTCDTFFSSSLRILHSFIYSFLSLGFPHQIDTRTPNTVRRKKNGGKTLTRYFIFFIVIAENHPHH